MKRVMAVLVVSVLGACKAPSSSQAPASKFTLQQLAARFPADLGPETVDVSGYPDKARAGYDQFLAVCSQCHTPARALWAPESGRADWDRHIRRMHEKTLVHGWWTAFGKPEAVRVLDFLDHDSRVRKLERKAEFAAKRAELEALFAEVQTERERLELTEGRQAARPAPPYVGDRP